MAHEGFHEPIDQLQPATLDRHRAIESIMEELEAVDWYDQRVDAASDAELAAILAHNRDEEKEHAAMALEWLRRQDPTLDRHLRTYLFTSGSVLEIEDATTSDAAAGDGGGSSASASASASGSDAGSAAGGPAAPPADGSLGIGSLRRSAATLAIIPLEHR